jgi:hypothetical protein
VVTLERGTRSLVLFPIFAAKSNKTVLWKVPIPRLEGFGDNPKLLLLNLDLPITLLFFNQKRQQH